MTVRRLAAGALLALGVVQLLALPGYYSPGAALAGGAVGVLLLVAAYLVRPGGFDADRVLERGQ